MARGKRERRILAVTGAAALVAVGLNILFSALKAHRAKKNKKQAFPGSNVQINLSASEIHKLADYIISKSRETYDFLATIPLDKATFANVIAPLAELEACQFPLVQSCVFPRMVSTSTDIRQASAEAEKRLDLHFSICRKREDVYRVVKAVLNRELLNSEEKRYIDCMVKEFERNGVNLTESKRKEMDSLKMRIDELCLQYIQNLDTDNSFVVFSEPELSGMPTEFLKNLEKTDNSKLKVLLRSYHVTPILEHCKVGATRKLIAVAYGQRCGKANIEILENLVHLRHKLARLLGYSSFADFAVECRMVKTSAKVIEFLEGVSSSLSDLAAAELDLLRDLKVQEEQCSTVGMEDLLYYMKRAEEQQCDVDLGEIKQYFPLNVVLSGIFKIFQDLFGVRFDEIKDADVWHDSVSLFSVLDICSNKLLGYFYLDLFCREGKFSHTCVLPLQNGCLCLSGVRQIPIALLISQCPKQIDGNPVLLRFPEVVNLFHEFTHVVHHMCNYATFSRFCGLQLEADFVEIPGQLLENWCYESISLKMMSGFYQDITKSVSTEMCYSLRKRRNLFSGLKLKQEILLCLIDQIIHTNEDVDIVELLKHLHPKVMLGLPLLEGTNPASCFPRIAVGYEAICYSYLWSEVFAVDIFSSKFQVDLLNQYEGLQFRKKVLTHGGSKDSHKILVDYLGREFSIQSFTRSKNSNLL